MGFRFRSLRLQELGMGHARMLTRQRVVDWTSAAVRKRTALDPLSLV